MSKVTASQRSHLGTQTLRRYLASTPGGIWKDLNSLLAKIARGHSTQKRSAISSSSVLVASGPSRIKKHKHRSRKQSRCKPQGTTIQDSFSRPSKQSHTCSVPPTPQYHPTLPSFSSLFRPFRLGIGCASFYRSGKYLRITG